MREERWLPVPGYEGCYEVSDFGRVRSLDRFIVSRKGGTEYVARRRGQILSPRTAARTPHPWVGLSRNGRAAESYVHSLVLAAFVGPRPAGLVACHGDDNPTNNLLENLRWDTESENKLDLLRLGTNFHANKTHCPQGHPYDALNTHVSARGHRSCRVCNREAVARYQSRRRAASARARAAA